MTHVWPNPGLDREFGGADAPALVGRRGHACVFFDERAGRSCRIHTALGHEALPLACRQFPRVSVRDPRGVSVTLSHYCPTAATLLDENVGVAIVESPPAYPADGEYVGLDARTSLPPLVRPDMLMDWESWWEWERLAIDHLAARSNSPAEALDELSAVVEHIRGWTPDDGPLADRVRAAYTVGGKSRRTAGPARDRLLRDVLAAIPDDLRPATFTPVARPSDQVTRRFLTAHAFASWTAHLGQGLRTWLRSLDAALALLDEGFGVRQADLILRHLADPNELAKTWSAAETDVGTVALQNYRRRL